MATPNVTRPAAGRRLLNLAHGSDVTVQLDGEAPDPGSTPAEDVLLPEVLTKVKTDVKKYTHEATTAFDYLFGTIAQDFPNSHLPTDDPVSVAAALIALGNTMVDPNPAPDGSPGQGAASTIPTVYTYWGQFIDHDITAKTDRDDSLVGSITADPFVPSTPTNARKLVNLRHPYLNLDSVYSTGPAFGGKTTSAQAFFNGPFLQTRPVVELPGTQVPFLHVPREDDADRDLPRDEETSGGLTLHTARIGDARNDENLVVAQLHLAFLRFHNEVVKAVKTRESFAAKSDKEVYEEAHRLVLLHYQWLVVNDYLRTVTQPGVVDQVLLTGVAPFSKRLFMPLEFSTAAFRFGHSMIRDDYDFNVNFGGAGQATLVQLFQFTGRGQFRGAPGLPHNWPIQWLRFTNKGSASVRHFARRIDTRVAPSLLTMRNQGNVDGEQALLAERVSKILKSLPARNLLRGYLLAIPTGQAVAKAVGARVLTSGELLAGSSQETQDALNADGGRFLEKTPLWFYLLKESETITNGNSLGPVGSRIVAETLIGLLRHDPDSFLNQDWTPGSPDAVRLPGGRVIVTIADLFEFAGVLT